MARAKKTATPEERERLKDKRIQRKFGITLADRDARIREQNNKCQTCGVPFDESHPPNIDHYHFRVRAFRVSPGDLLFAPAHKWRACGFTEKDAVYCTRTAKTKSAAIEAVKQIMRPWSVRGVLCFKCNWGLGAIEKMFDAARCPENLFSVIKYLNARVKKDLDLSLAL
jgi:predicted Zn-ribbon and HTH transcriptional regulator